MDLTGIFANASTYQLAGAAAGLVLAGGVHYLLNGMSQGLKVVGTLAGVGADTILTLAGSREKRTAPPPPTAMQKLGSKAADILLPTVFYGAAALAGFVTGAGVESIVTKNTAQNPVPAVQNQQQIPAPH